MVSVEIFTVVSTLQIPKPLPSKIAVSLGPGAPAPAVPPALADQLVAFDQLPAVEATQYLVTPPPGVKIHQLLLPLLTIGVG